jgi:hypothetical protein
MDDSSSSCTYPRNDNRRANPPQPSDPTPWFWKCHLCQQWYQLGVTTRCLIDGHRLCSSFSNRPLGKRKNQYCVTRFDYKGWRELHDWRKRLRKASPRRINPRALSPRPKMHNCWNDCEYPSMCIHDALRSLDPPSPSEDGSPSKKRKTER